MLSNISNEKEWRSFISQFSVKPELNKEHNEILEELKELVLGVIKENIPEEKFGVLFSGGVDSTLIAKVCKDFKKDFICYTAALEEKGLKQAEDLVYAKKVAEKLGLKLKIKTIGLKETEEYIKKILKILKCQKSKISEHAQKKLIGNEFFSTEPNVVKVGVALPFYVAYEIAKKDGVNIMFSGLGSEELFAGYERHTKARDVNEECFNGLLNMYERDITRDIAVAKALKIELRVPYLDEKLIKYALKIPAEFKLSVSQNKLILREVAEQLGLKEFAWRKKRAAQYGSRFDRALDILARRNGFKYKKYYLESLL